MGRAFIFDPHAWSGMPHVVDVPEGHHRVQVARIDPNRQPVVRPTSSGFALYGGFVVEAGSLQAFEIMAQLPVWPERRPRDVIDTLPGQIRYRLDLGAGVGPQRLLLQAGPFTVLSGGGEIGWGQLACHRCGWVGKSRAWSQRRHMVTDSTKHVCDDLRRL